MYVLDPKTVDYILWNFGI